LKYYDEDEPVRSWLTLSRRFTASKVHRHFVKEARRNVQKLAWQVREGGISPTVVGAMPLAFPVPDSLEIAFGYRGNLRFVQFRVHNRYLEIWIQRQMGGEPKTS
jgi:hypothetical protein